jgi:hypothetical protein
MKMNKKKTSNFYVCNFSIKRNKNNVYINIYIKHGKLMTKKNNFDDVVVGVLLLAIFFINSVFFKPTMKTFLTPFFYLFRRRFVNHVFFLMEV